MTVSLKPRATPASESTQLPPPAESTTQTATAPVFTYVTPPATSSQSLNSIGTGNSNSGFTPPIQGGVSLGVCVVLLAAGLLAHRYNKRRLNKRSEANQDSTSTPEDPNPSMSESPAQHMSSRQREKMPASNNTFQTIVDDDEIRPVTPQRAFFAPKRGGRADDDSSSLMISPC
ncbi:hypothetical protein TRIATDRAFT_260254 [Trichoderma atroviride IMI 206040]|uniref:Uncharacterized protein n=1 Tax=Hypocrea atroviridis (strain ATCC 20476 / IMI 206040) TaxID=452589 RepID=G9PCJ7_HYPAI|nr:uncharacterized protein TRIATDRAFT_260254 [Trichoderma atroviride IMI 206040]EHK39571.1 hypothetical protein TRIATDRAFT_260254 [Trichoderma atroviride IMI 206040]